MPRDFPTGTVTFLFTDVEGSTKLLHNLGAEGYAAVLSEHRRLIREACSRHAGVEVDTQGDAFFLAFPTAPGALAAAAQMTEALASGPIRVRIGLHTGTPLLLEEGYVGGDVHRAARIAACGHGGQVLISSSTAQLVDVELADLGEHRFKDLSAPERVYQLGQQNFPALNSLYRTNLPVPATPFLGRERELQQVVDLLLRPEVRLLTLTGPGGTGKTRLALQAAAEAAERFRDGITWVPLAPLRDPSLLLPSVAEALEVKEEPGRSLADTLAGALGGKQALLLLDNVEHLLPDAAAELAQLASTPGPALLVTSRERLQLRGEQLYPVPTLGERDGAELFLARARALEPAFRANGSVEELCSRLDNLPLALELAAARTVVFSPEQLLERLSQRLDLLKAGRDADPRQQTLRATIEWSYQLLEVEEQRLFRSLSVFAGGCTYEAAEEVCGADPDTLQSLLDKSLLRRRDTDLGPRYWMLETIREYAAGQLHAQGEGAAQTRYRRFFLALTEQAEPELWGGQDEAFVRLESENANLRAALGSAVADGDTEIALRLAVSMYRFWEIRSRYGEARDWLSQALALDGGTADLRAKALMGVGRAGNFQCDWSEAIAALERSADSFRALHDLVGISRCLGFLGHAYLFTGDPARAADVLEENLATARHTGDVQTIANALYNLAFVYVERREFARARKLFEEARGIHDSLRNTYGVAVVAIQLGSTATLAGDYERAAIELGTGLREAEEMGSPLWSFLALRHLAQLALLEGRTHEAERLFVTCGGQLGEVAAWEAAHWLNDLAALAAAKEDAPRAARLWGAADAAFEALGLALLEQNRVLRNRFMPRTRDALDQASWCAAWIEGHEMSIAEAIADALEESAPALPLLGHHPE